MTSGELAIVVLVGVGAVASLVLFILMPRRSRRPDRAINESLVAQQWAGDLGHYHHTPSTPDLPTHGGIDSPS